MYPSNCWVKTHNRQLHRNRIAFELDTHVQHVHRSQFSCIQNTEHIEKGAEVLFYINDSLHFVVSRTRKRHGTHSSIVGKCASVRQIESVSQSMLSGEDLYTAKIFILCREIQLFFCLYFVISHNEIDSGWLKQWQRNQQKSKWKPKILFRQPFNLISSNGLFFFCWLNNKKQKSVLFFSYRKEFFFSINF